MLRRTKNLTTGRIAVETARIDVLQRLYQECLMDIPDASQVTVTVTAFDLEIPEGERPRGELA